MSSVEFEGKLYNEKTMARTHFHVGDIHGGGVKFLQGNKDL